MANRKRSSSRTNSAALTPKSQSPVNTDISQSLGAEGSEDIVAYQSQFVFEQSRGPIPSAAEIARYAQVYPDAPKILFNELQTESAHRRTIEQEIVRTESRRADRGQLIAATVFILGLLIGGGLVALDHDVAGATIVGADLVSGAAIFLRQNNRADADPLPKDEPSEGSGE
jgi:uncharacterized membrane protein